MLDTHRRSWNDAPRILIPLLLAFVWSGCENPDQWESVAKRCADVVHAYLESPSPVEIVGKPVQYSEGSVKISYRTSDGENVPVEGSASCNFAIGDGQMTLMEASVGGVELTGQALETVQQQLGARS